MWRSPQNDRGVRTPGADRGRAEPVERQATGLTTHYKCSAEEAPPSVIKEAGPNTIFVLSVHPISLSTPLVQLLGTSCGKFSKHNRRRAIDEEHQAPRAAHAYISVSDILLNWEEGCRVLK